MNTSKREQLLAKLKKVMALRNSPDPGEAAAAIQMAAKLMREHGLTEAEAELLEVKEESTKLRRFKPTDYDNLLINMVAEVFGCEVFINMNHGFPGLIPAHSHVIFIGEEPASEIATYAFQVLSRRLHVARQDYLATIPRRFKRSNRTKRADEYAMGWVMGCNRAVQSIRPPQEPSAKVAAYMDNKYPDLQTKSGRNTGGYEGSRDYDDVYRGIRDGKKQRLEAGVAGGGSGSPKPKQLDRG
jgi:hypothetical protein